MRHMNDSVSRPPARMPVIGRRVGCAWPGAPGRSGAAAMGRGRAQHGLGDVDVGDLGELGQADATRWRTGPARGCDGKAIGSVRLRAGSCLEHPGCWVSWVTRWCGCGISARPVARWPVTYRSSRIGP